MYIDYSQTCIKRSTMEQRKSCLLQCKRCDLKDIQFIWNFLWQDKKRRPFIIHWWLLKGGDLMNRFDCIKYEMKACRGRDHMVVGFTTTYAISAYQHWCCEFESRSGRGVQHYVIKFVSDLQQVSGFIRVLLFPPPIKPTARCNWNNIESGVKHHQINKHLITVDHQIQTNLQIVWFTVCLRLIIGQD